MSASKESVEQTIETYQQAAEANRSTTARHGNLVEISSEIADDVMVTADLHGQRLNFQQLHRRADLASHPSRHIILQEVLHGGPAYPSGRGCMSHLLLEDVARWKLEYPQRVHFILSNHELSELTEFPIAKGGRVLNLQLRLGMQEQYGDAADKVREAAMEFIATCPLAVRLSNGVFICHGSPNLVDDEGFDIGVFSRPLTRSDFTVGASAFRLVWGRDFRQENADAFAKLVEADILIHGHEPCAEGYSVPNRRQLILDCCNRCPCYVILPIDQKLTLDEIVKRIERI